MHKLAVASVLVLGAMAGFGCAESGEGVFPGNTGGASNGGTSTGGTSTGGTSTGGTSTGGTSTGGTSTGGSGTGGSGGWCTNPIICPDNGSGEPCCVTPDGPCGYMASGTCTGTPPPDP